MSTKIFTTAATPSAIESAYKAAQERYAALGVDTEAALKRLAGVPVSLHCWQGDDVGGFEKAGEELGGGLAVTGNYPGKARTPEELRSDTIKALSLIPGKHRFNLHASYAETGGRRVERNQLCPEHFQGWIDWCKERGLGMDFNPTYFAHPKAADGMKDLPVDRVAPRQRLTEALDEVFAAPLDPAHNLDAVESKLFGIGSESYVVGSHEYYLGYAITRKKLLCLDTGHFHPTETIVDKLSAVFTQLDEILLHVSRGIRWDSDHVVIVDDSLLAIAQELVRGNFLNRTHIGLDYFDASINRVAAWVIGARAMLKALLIALLEPIHLLRDLETTGDYTARLALLEELKTMPYAAVWDYYCLKQNVPVGAAWIGTVKQYETDVLAKRR